MPSLISGSTLRAGGSNTFIKLSNAQPQLPASPTTTTGYTVVTNSVLVTTYRSSLGNIEFHQGQMYSNLPDQNIRIIGTGTSTVIVSGGIANTGTNTGALIVDGGIGIRDGLWAGQDINVNGLTIGQGYQTYPGTNNIVLRGKAVPLNVGYAGQAGIAIGYDTLQGIDSSLKSIAIGRYALSSGTDITNSIAIGDSALKLLGTIPGKLTNSNIALGNNSGENLIDGELNLFLGQGIAPNFTTGSNNFFVGHEIGINMVSGNGNIAIGGDNLRDGFDNQINIGSMLYYDGGGYLQLNADTGLGLGTHASNLAQVGVVSTLTTSTVPLVVTSIKHGLLSGENIIITGVAGTTQINDNIYYVKSLTTNTFSLYSDLALTVPVDGTSFGDYVSSGTIYSIQPNGALVVLGGAYITDNLIVDNELSVASTATFKGDLFARGTGTVKIYPSVLGHIDATSIGYYQPEEGHFTNLYANTLTVDNFVIRFVDGTIDKAHNIADGEKGSIPIQSSTGTTVFIPIGPLDTVLVSDGSTATWQSLSNLSANVSIATATNAYNVFVDPVTAQFTYYLALSEQIDDFSPIASESNLTFKAESTATGIPGMLTTPALTVTSTSTTTGGVKVSGSVYSREGGPLEGGLLYTPRTVIDSAPPSDPRVGDFWIDYINNAGFQYINDGGNKFWLQIFLL